MKFLPVRRRVLRCDHHQDVLLGLGAAGVGVKNAGSTAWRPVIATNPMCAYGLNDVGTDVSFRGVSLIAYRAFWPSAHQVCSGAVSSARNQNSK
jgi:hypothetical protein